MKQLSLRAHAVSDVGCVRQNNEDAWVIRPDLSLYALADGMGGHLAGEVASKETIANFCAAFAKVLPNCVSVENVAHSADLALQKANSHVYRLSHESRERQGMGTTFCALTFWQGSVIAINVGDSRIYRMRNETLYPLTTDHSLRRELLDSGCFDERDLDSLSCKHVLTKAVGTTREIDPTIVIYPACAKDLYLLCSDGLTDMVTEEEISEILLRPRPIEEKVRTLVALAKEHGGVDNITVILVEVI